MIQTGLRTPCQQSCNVTQENNTGGQRARFQKRSELGQDSAAPQSIPSGRTLPAQRRCPRGRTDQDPAGGPCLWGEGSISRSWENTVTRSRKAEAPATPQTPGRPPSEAQANSPVIKFHAGGIQRYFCRGILVQENKPFFQITG